MTFRKRKVVCARDAWPPAPNWMKWYSSKKKGLTSGFSNLFCATCRACFSSSPARHSQNAHFLRAKPEARVTVPWRKIYIKVWFYRYRTGQHCSLQFSFLSYSHLNSLKWVRISFSLSSPSLINDNNMITRSMHPQTGWIFEGCLRNCLGTRSGWQNYSCSFEKPAAW